MAGILVAVLATISVLASLSRIVRASERAADALERLVGRETAASPDHET